AGTAAGQQRGADTHGDARPGDDEIQHARHAISFARSRAARVLKWWAQSTVKLELTFMVGPSKAGNLCPCTASRTHGTIPASVRLLGAEALTPVTRPRPSTPKLYFTVPRPSSSTRAAASRTHAWNAPSSLASSRSIAASLSRPVPSDMPIV